jgi:hypothetical protein
MKHVKGKRARRWWIFVLSFSIAAISWVNVWISVANGDLRGDLENLHLKSTPLQNMLSQSIFSTVDERGSESTSIPSPPVSDGRDNSLHTRSEPRSTTVARHPPFSSLEFPPLPKVQAWPDHGDTKPPKNLPPTDRTLIETVEDLVSVRSDLEILLGHVAIPDSNPVQPSMKDHSNPLSLLNLDIPLDYSVAAPVTSTIPWSNETTMAFYEGRFRSGFRNQIMAFMILIFESQREHSDQDGTSGRRRHGQILLRSLGQKDTYGSNSFIPFAKLWDVAHWNSHYPKLPRLVDYDPVLHSQFNYDNTRWYRTPTFVNASTSLPAGIKEPVPNLFGTYGLFASTKPIRPYAYGYQHKLMAAYTFYGKGKGRYAGNEASSGQLRNPIEILLLQGAMRPHPELQAIVDGLLQNASLLEVGESTAAAGMGSSPLQLDYITLHARVEPDMQKHKMCPEKKVVNLTDIFRFMETKWKDPPVSRIFMPINRQYLEWEGGVFGNATYGGSSTKRLTGQETIDTVAGKKINWIAVENLNALNRARDEGLWNGRAKVLEFGANALEGTSYAKKPSTAGAMLNFFIGIPAKIFIGTEVSSFSHDILATRFFRGYGNNYRYLPEGLMDWTPAGTKNPPGFQC